MVNEKPDCKPGFLAIYLSYLISKAIMPAFYQRQKCDICKTKHMPIEECKVKK